VTYCQPVQTRATDPNSPRMPELAHRPPSAHPLIGIMRVIGAQCPPVLSGFSPRCELSCQRTHPLAFRRMRGRPVDQRYPVRAREARYGHAIVAGKNYGQGSSASMPAAPRSSRSRSSSHPGFATAPSRSRRQHGLHPGTALSRPAIVARASAPPATACPQAASGSTCSPSTARRKPRRANSGSRRPWPRCGWENPQRLAMAGQRS